MQEDVHKKNVEKEARKASVSSFVVLANKLKDKGKYFLEIPKKENLSSTLEILHKVVELKKNNG